MTDIKVGGPELDGIVSRVANRIVDRAAVRALNTTVRAVREEARRVIEDKLKVKLKRGDLKSKLQMKIATTRKKQATLLIVDRGTPLIRFSAKRVIVQTPRGRRIGFSVEVKGKRELAAGAFRITMKSGKQGLFARTTKARLPIEQLFSSEVGDLFKDLSVVARIKAFAVDTFNKNFEREYKYYLSKARSP